MDTKIFEDKRAGDLLSRVGDDLSSLRHDVAHLVQYTGRHTLPEAMRSGRDHARGGIVRAGRVAREHPTGISAGGVLLLGAVAAGLWLLFIKGNGCCELPERDG